MKRIKDLEKEVKEMKKMSVKIVSPGCDGDRSLKGICKKISDIHNRRISFDIELAYQEAMDQDNTEYEKSLIDALSQVYITT